jgi:methyltransferase (TIGR00027 family)
MKPGQPSRTAEYMAFFRACESVRPKGKRLFFDPLATLFIRRSLRAAVWVSRIPMLGASVDWCADRRLPGARTSAIARTRLIDDATHQVLHDKFRQIVVLGAGFDSRAYRLPGIRSATVFEVDHHNTLAWKLFCLRKVLPGLPQHVRYVPLDFNRERLPQLLAEAGFVPSLPAMFVWEGVTNYLTSKAVDSVLRYVASCAPDSRIVFTYVHSGALDGSVCFAGAAKLIKDVEQLGEPWTFGLDPAAVPGFLVQRGLRLDRDASADEYRTQLYGADGRHMKGYEFYHVVIAHVPTTATQTEADTPAANQAEQDEAPGSLHA